MQLDDDDGMGELAAETAQQVDEQLSDRELRVLSRTDSKKFKELVAKVSDPAIANKLIAIVDDSSKKNEDVAQLKSRVSQLGAGGWKVAKELCSLIKIV